jgi:predicted nucleic acid-binding protein
VSQLVLDASVAVKWFLPPKDEDLIPEALHLLQRHLKGTVQFLVPDLFWVEFASAGWKAVRRGRWEPFDATRALAKVLSYRLPTFPTDQLVGQAFDIASTQNRAIYDSVYIALAQQSRCEMITADERLVNALGSRFPVRWLGSFQQMH